MKRKEKERKIMKIIHYNIHHFISSLKSLILYANKVLPISLQLLHKKQGKTFRTNSICDHACLPYVQSSRRRFRRLSPVRLFAASLAPPATQSMRPRSQMYAYCRERNKNRVPILMTLTAKMYPDNYNLAGYGKPIENADIFSNFGRRGLIILLNKLNN